MKWSLDSGRLNEGNVPVQDWGWRCRDGGITEIETKQNEQGAGTRPGERFLSNQPLSRLEKGHGYGGSWGQGEGRSSLPGTVYRTARERGMTTLVFLDWRH